MLNRRHLRVKVLQALYAYHLSENKVVKVLEKRLLESVDEVYEMYIWLLALLAEVSDYAMIDADERANKYLPTENDLNANVKLHSNKFINLLKEHNDYQSLLKKYKVSWSFDPEVVKTIFNILKESEQYQAYLNNSDSSLRSEKEIIKYIYKKIIKVTPSVEQVFEEKFINWPVDKEVLEAMLAKTFSNFQSENAAENKLAQISPAWHEDREFILDLLGRTISFDEEYQQYISDKTRNWDAERIAIIDVLLMKMAITELVHFPSIPVKVTMNEYIEIAKEFSSPKSNLFINGILDKILDDLKQAGKIRKTGRGLIE
ncbi:transcription antitermination factor NusB [Arcticibacter tournemirensis]|uniref:Transcription antitermination factor NusB n=1 Tax=Arcticibacter tournemirensis TaxID=699437 RepID=A0A4V1KIL8_9SPHI|nr:transcription antitermination factor NusB [Arcticibacter tournemirensis]RXF71142.1 transcription antitermination factor NusB [Arcticibacter tournemirensis]